MPWYKIELTNAQLIELKNIEIFDKFDAVWLANGCPEGFCLFSSERKGDIEMTYYFSPDSVDLMMKVINEYNGEECSKPDKDEVGVNPVIGIQGSGNELL